MNTNNQKKKSGLSRDQKRQNIQRIVFAVIAVILIISWILTLVVKF
jgi:predicted nucleic acid-binding Zn ribbon protein